MLRKLDYKVIFNDKKITQKKIEANIDIKENNSLKL
jgi:DNA-binding Xre family transcriptional regulator